MGSELRKWPNCVAILCLLLGKLSITSAGIRKRRQLPQRRDQGELSPRIVGGYIARNGRYPYAQISLANDAGLHECGGSLIAPDVVLTAGHCHGYFSQIRVGIYDVKSQLQSYQAFSAIRVHFNPRFDEQFFRYDFLVLRLNGTVSNIDPVVLNSDHSIPTVGEELTVVGWGLTDTSNSNSYPDALREVTVDYITNNACANTESNGQKLYQGYIFDEMICAAAPGKDACSGDSGGPLLQTGSQANQDIQVGVVSWGNGCATAFPGVYSRVSYQFDWIKGLVCSISIAPPEYFGCGSSSVISSAQEAPTQTPAPAPAPTPTPASAPASVSQSIPRPDSAPQGYLPIRVDIQLDLRSTETGWSLQSEDGGVIAAVDPGHYKNAYQLVHQVVYLPPLKQFIFTISDTGGDGICCSSGDGWFQVAVVMSDGITDPLVKGYGIFSSFSSNNFTTPANNSYSVQINNQKRPALQGSQLNATTPLPDGLSGPSVANSDATAVSEAAKSSGVYYSLSLASQTSTLCILFMLLQ